VGAVAEPVEVVCGDDGAGGGGVCGTGGVTAAPEVIGALIVTSAVVTRAVVTPTVVTSAVASVVVTAGDAVVLTSVGALARVTESDDALPEVAVGSAAVGGTADGVANGALAPRPELAGAPEVLTGPGPAVGISLPGGEVPAKPGTVTTTVPAPVPTGRASPDAGAAADREKGADEDPSAPRTGTVHPASTIATARPALNAVNRARPAPVAVTISLPI